MSEKTEEDKISELSEKSFYMIYLETCQHLMSLNEAVSSETRCVTELSKALARKVAGLLTLMTETQKQGLAGGLAQAVNLLDVCIHRIHASSSMGAQLTNAYKVWIADRGEAVLNVARGAHDLETLLTGKEPEGPSEELREFAEKILEQMENQKSGGSSSDEP